jgi:hypothetical protein
MERSDILATMGELKLYGMKAAFDEIIATAVKRQHEPQRIVGDLLTAEISEKQARSVKYQITIAKLPVPLWTNQHVTHPSGFSRSLSD